MTAVFLKLLNISLTASIVVLVVILLRLILRRAPKFINCILWAIVGARLCLPFTIESKLSLVPAGEPVQMPSGNLVDAVPQADYVGEAAPTVFEQFIGAASVIWIVGIVLMLAYAFVSYVALKRKVSASIADRGCYICDNISTPFILGVIHPRIYLPSNLKGRERIFVLAHERAHIKRFDNLWKPLAYILLTVYWFNPVMWVAYILLSRDIELACDEKVAKKLKQNDIIEYSETLLNLGVTRFRVAACPVAFGEVSIKTRVRNVLNYKKPAFWIIIAAIVVCIIVAVCFLTARPKDKEDTPNAETEETRITKETESAAPGEHAHTWESEAEAEVSCTVDGITKFTCSDCGETYTETHEKTGHSYKSAVTTTATCSVKGVITYTCENCGDVYTEETDIAPDDHTYTFNTTREPTCVDAGSRTYTCVGCGDSYTEEYYYDNPLYGHSYDITGSTVKCFEDGEIFYKCRYCGKEDTKPGKANGHEWNSATCTEPLTCKNCGETKGEPYGHKLNDKNYCTRCGKYVHGINITGFRGTDTKIYQEDGYFTITNCRADYSDELGVTIYFTIDCTNLQGYDMGAPPNIGCPNYMIQLINKDTGEVVQKSYSGGKWDLPGVYEWEHSFYGGHIGVPPGDYIVEFTPKPPYSN